MAKSSILVYKGLGASETGWIHLITALRSCVNLNKYDVDFVTPEEIIKGASFYITVTILALLLKETDHY